MQNHIDKIDKFFEVNTTTRDCYRFKILQMIYQGVLLIPLGVVGIENANYCSSPINVFLQGLFVLYLIGLIVNLVVGMARMCQKYCMTGVYKKTIEGVTLGLDVCYFPLYWGFSIFEFIWYILGTVWYARDSDCSEEYPEGYTLTIGLLVCWYILLLVTLCCVFGFNFYVRGYNPPQEQPPPNIQTHSPNEHPKDLSQTPPYETNPQTPQRNRSLPMRPEDNQPRHYDPRYDPNYDPRYDPNYDPRYEPHPRYDPHHDPRYDPNYDPMYRQESPSVREFGTEDPRRQGLFPEEAPPTFREPGHSPSQAF